jgi:uncharacterized RDD family membrane protein YckC
MDSIDILSGQNVVIKYHAASIGKRACAILVDWVVLVAYVRTAFYLVDAFYSVFPRGALLTVLIVLLLPAIFYHFLFESIFGGQTLGKMLLKIKVTNIDGTPTRIGGFFLRWLLMSVDLWVYGIVGVIAIANSKYSQRLGDMAAGTVVVKTKIKHNIELYAGFYTFHPQYATAYPNVVNVLSDAQVAFVINLLIEATGKKAYNTDIALIAQKVSKLLDAKHTVASPERNKLFLKTVAMDYNYMALHGSL